MTDNLPLLAILGFVLFVGGFLTGFGLSGWLRAPEDWRPARPAPVPRPDPTDEAAA